MRRLIFSQRARTELSSIRAYIAKDAPVAAADMVKRLATACERLPRFPQIGRMGLIPGTRELVTVQPYIIIYEVTDDAINIVRVMHSAQDR